MEKLEKNQNIETDNMNDYLHRDVEFLRVKPKQSMR